MAKKRFRHDTQLVPLSCSLCVWVVDCHTRWLARCEAVKDTRTRGDTGTRSRGGEAPRGCAEAEPPPGKLSPGLARHRSRPPFPSSPVPSLPLPPPQRTANKDKYLLTRLPQPRCGTVLLGFAELPKFASPSAGSPPFLPVARVPLSSPRLPRRAQPHAFSPREREAALLPETSRVPPATAGASAPKNSGKS